MGSVLGGGKFVDGAVTGAFSYLYGEIARDNFELIEKIFFDPESGPIVIEMNVDVRYQRVFVDENGKPYPPDLQRSFEKAWDKRKYVSKPGTTVTVQVPDVSATMDFTPKLGSEGLVIVVKPSVSVTNPPPMNFAPEAPVYGPPVEGSGG